MIKTKWCSECQRTKKLSEFYKDRTTASGYRYSCRSCSIKFTKSWRKRQGHKKLAERQKQYNRNCRLETIARYGGCCICCGETQFEFLSFDHINGNGKAHRKITGKGNTFVRWLIRNNYPDDIQILCHNCNLAKGFYGMCPHQIQREIAAIESKYPPIPEIEVLQP